MLSLNRARVAGGALRRSRPRAAPCVRSTRASLRPRCASSSSTAARRCCCSTPSSRPRRAWPPSCPACASCASAREYEELLAERAADAARLARQRGSPDRRRLHERHDGHPQGRRLHAPRGATSARSPISSRRAWARTAPTSGRCPCSTATAGASPGPCPASARRASCCRGPSPPRSGASCAPAPRTCARRRPCSSRCSPIADAAPLEHEVTCIVGGAPPSPTLIAGCEAVGIRLIHMYGLTETYGPGTVSAWPPEWDALPAEERAVLRARQGVPTVLGGQVDVWDREGAPVPRDGQTMGEVVLRGNTVMAGYLDDAEATAEAFRGGWFHSGDAAVVHAGRAHRAARSLQGRDHLGRREHLDDRGRAGARAAPRRARLRRRRDPRRALGRAAQGVRRAAAGDGRAAPAS